jgi:hypothetical protein
MSKLAVRVFIVKKSLDRCMLSLRFFKRAPGRMLKQSASGVLASLPKNVKRQA